MAGFAVSHNSKRVLVGILAVAAIVFILVMVVSSRRSADVVAAEKEKPPVTANVMTVVMATIPKEGTATGTIKPTVESTIAPKIMSTVAAVYVREGDRVKQGQVLIRLESRDLQAQVSQARAAVASAQANAKKARTGVSLQRAETSTSIASAESALQAARQQLSIAQEGPRRQEKAQANLAVAQARAQFKNAQTEYNRMQRLYDQGVVPKQRLEAAETTFEVAKAQYESAKEQADLVEEGTRIQEIRAAKERVRQAEEALRMARASSVQNTMSARTAEAAASQVQEAQAALQFAQTQLSYATIRSPISGVVSRRMVDPGDTVTPGVAVIAIEDDSVYRMEAKVAASDMESLYLGKNVRIDIGSEERTGTGTVAVISPEGDPNSHKFLVKVNIPKELNPRTGNFGRIYFEKGFTTGIMVPQSAIRHDGGLEKVFVVSRQGHAQMRVIKTGRIIDSSVEVLSGLQPGDKLIVESQGLLQDGAPVKVREA